MVSKSNIHPILVTVGNQATFTKSKQIHPTKAPTLNTNTTLKELTYPTLEKGNPSSKVTNRRGCVCSQEGTTP